MDEPKRDRAARWILMALVAAVALATRLPAPWQRNLINDEMHHLESWRNRYRTDDIYPLFLKKLESGGRVDKRKIEMVRRLYRGSPLFQRAMLVLVDPQPPLFPAVAETIEAATHSSLLALRIPSMLLSLTAIALAYLLGRRMWDNSAGLWLAGLTTIGALGQYYAGIGRPYAWSQCSLMLALFIYVRQRGRGENGRAFLASALVAQSIQWMCWAMVGPLVICHLIERYRQEGFGKLLKRTWWYFLLSGLLLAEMMIQLKNPTVANQGGARGAMTVWRDLRVAGPFAHLGSVSRIVLNIGAAAFVALAIVGGWAAIRRRMPGGIGIVASAGCGLLAAMVIGSSPRFMVSYLAPSMVLAAVGSCAALRMATVNRAILGLVVVGIGTIAIVKPASEYEWNTYDVPYPPVADALRSRLRPDDIWVAYPYHLGDCLYRFGPLPRPVAPTNFQELQEALARGNPSGEVYVITLSDLIDRCPQLRAARREAVFMGRTVLLQVDGTTDRKQ